jgi:hypothetical protein
VYFDLLFIAIRWVDIVPIAIDRLSSIYHEVCLHKETATQVLADLTLGSEIQHVALVIYRWLELHGKKTQPVCYTHNVCSSSFTNSVCLQVQFLNALASSWCATTLPSHKILAHGATNTHSREVAAEHWHYYHLAFGWSSWHLLGLAWYVYPCSFDFLMFLLMNLLVL